MRKIALLQPSIPHYRKEFFDILKESCQWLDIYIYQQQEALLQVKNEGNIISNWKWMKNRLLFYNPLPFLFRRYDTLVLMWHFGHITTWLLLITNCLHRKNIILWGQGISVKRYLQEEKKVDWKLRLMLWMADGAWVYMQKEEKQWQSIFPKKPIVALMNSISGVAEMINYQHSTAKAELKGKYGISQPRILLFCARFVGNIRRIDLLEETIRRLPADIFGFIIIGTGESKPDFSIYPNVYDFGALYDDLIKRELFTMADLYFQPGWVGLSIVEAMAYGKPICTFKRTRQTPQCVEYDYIRDGENGLIFKNLEDCLQRFSEITNKDIDRMGENSRQFVQKNLLIQQMVERALSVL